MAIEVFEGNVGDPATLAESGRQAQGAVRARARRAGRRSRHDHRGADRGGPQARRARLDHHAAGASDPQPRQRPAACNCRCSTSAISPTITSPDYPGERLVACRNPLLADERARKRDDLLVATEKKLAAIAARVHRAKKPLRGKDKIALAIGRVIDKYKMAKHFDLNITDDRFTFARNTAKIDAEAALDGVYVVRTTVSRSGARSNLDGHRLQTALDRRTRLPQPQDRRSRGPADLSSPRRPRTGPRVLVHARLLCRMAHAPDAQTDPVRRSRQGRGRRRTALRRRQGGALRGRPAQGPQPRTDDGLPVHSFRSLLADLATVTRNIMAMDGAPEASFVLYPQLTPVQDRAFQLLDLGVKV